MEDGQVTDNVSGGSGSLGVLGQDVDLEQRISDLFDSKPTKIDAVLCKIGEVEIRENSFRSLRPKGWLFGDIIEGYIRHFTNKTGHCTTLSAYFFSSLVDSGVDATLRRFRKSLRKITGDEQLLFIPTHYHDHWTLAVVDRNLHTLRYYDSCLGEQYAALKLISSVLVKASVTNRSLTISFPKDIPRQTNQYDCGVFVCQYARCLATSAPFEFCEEDMVAHRRDMARLLLRKDYVQDDPLESVMMDVINEDDGCDDTCDGVLSDMSVGDGLLMNVDCENADEGADTLDMGRLRLHGLKWYSPGECSLAVMRSEVEPFVDLDEAGLEFTANADRDWKRLLKLSEILDVLGSGGEDPWEALARKIKEDPQVAFSWVSRAPPPTTPLGPKHFRFGSAKNFKKVQRLIQAALPGIKVKNPHGQRRAGKSVRARKQL